MKTVKTLNEAMKYFANGIWKHGESKEKGCQGLIPFSFDNKKILTPYEQASKIVCKKEGMPKVTHFDRRWKIRGKTVYLRFYKGDSYGACLDLKFVEEIVVDVEPK